MREGWEWHPFIFPMAIGNIKDITDSLTRRDTPIKCLLYFER